MKKIMLLLAGIVLFSACASQNASDKNSNVSKERAGEAFKDLDRETGKDTLQ